MIKRIIVLSAGLIDKLPRRMVKNFKITLKKNIIYGTMCFTSTV